MGYFFTFLSTKRLKQIWKKRIGFILLSSGIDGKINNQITTNDTIHTDNYMNYIEAYNIDSHHIFPESRGNLEHNFNINNLFFGKKDLIIDYVNCLEFYKFQANDMSSIEQMIVKIEKNFPRRKIYGFRGIVYVDSMNRYKQILYFKNN